MITTLLSGALVAQTIRMAVPYVCAGIGGVWSERSGIRGELERRIRIVIRRIIRQVVKSGHVFGVQRVDGLISGHGGGTIS